MAKFKIAAGAEVDVLTSKEVRDELKVFQASWMAEVGRGDRYRRFSAFCDTGGGTGVVLAAGQHIGPDPGFVWSVKRIALDSVFDPASHVMALYHDNVNGSALIKPDLDSYNSFDANQLILYPGDTLVFSGTATAEKRLWITGQIRELPISLAWRLG